MGPNEVFVPQFYLHPEKKLQLQALLLGFQKSGLWLQFWLPILESRVKIIWIGLSVEVSQRNILIKIFQNCTRNNKIVQIQSDSVSINWVKGSKNIFIENTSLAHDIYVMYMSLIKQYWIELHPK